VTHRRVAAVTGRRPAGDVPGRRAGPAARPAPGW
jgi:hypothetical protein